MIDSCVKFLKSEAEKDQQNDSFLASSQPEPEYDEEHFYAVSPYVFLKLFVDMQVDFHFLFHNVILSFCEGKIW